MFSRNAKKDKPLVSSLAPMRRHKTTSTALSKEARVTILAWAMRETAPWRLRGLSRAQLNSELSQLNADQPRAYIFDIFDGIVEIIPKPNIKNEEREQYRIRANLYKSFLQRVVTHGALNLSVTLAICMDDDWIHGSSIPTFAFQNLGEHSMSLPDPEFLARDFFSEEEYVDRLSFSEKCTRAVFVGSTTGAIITEEVARARSSPRLNAADYFYSQEDVSFRLPNLVQYEDEQALNALMALPFCGGDHATWQEQLRSKFIISMDGNGATCSRVFIALRSNSVLPKYESPYRLYYFDGLVPWRDFIPISNHSQVLEAIALERRRPGCFEYIAEAGRRFAETYLTREAVELYTAMLLRLYQECFSVDPLPSITVNRPGWP